MKDKSQVFSASNDIDVEIEYLYDQLQRVSEDNLMELKVSNLKTNKEHEKDAAIIQKPIFKAQQARISTLENLLLGNGP